LIKSFQISYGNAGGKGGSPYDFVVYGGSKFANSSIRLEAAEEGKGMNCGYDIEPTTIAPV